VQRDDAHGARQGLRAGLDLKAGGSLARDLDDLYAYLAMRLTLANLHNSASAKQRERALKKLLEYEADVKALAVAG
jgi:flagellin-specific chaperone FliS